MTLPIERTYALNNALIFLRKLLSPYEGGFKRIPKEVRREARAVLKHFPHNTEIMQLVCDCKCGVFKDKNKK